MERVNIIGAGPGGLTAAIVLRQYDIPVTVFEKHPEVGYRLNGDYQGLENWTSDTDVTETLKDIGVDINFLCKPCHGSVLYTRGMKPVDVRSDRPFFYLVKRGPMTGTFDTGLKEQALDLGAKILFENRRDHVAGKAIVGTGPKRADVVAVGITFDTSMEDTAMVVLDDDIAPKGYAYLLVDEGYGTMGTVLYRQYPKSQEFFGKTKRFFCDRTNVDIRDEKKFGGFGNFFLGNSQVRNDQLYVGETAGFQDGLWGFGMRYSIVSGYLAARSIIEGTDYDRLWSRELGPMLETSLVNRFLFEKFGHLGYKYLTKRLARTNPRNFLMRHYNTSALKRLLLPIARGNYISRVQDESCGHVNCTCVWCRYENSITTV
jgi:flavin-dependent dehydrogenase